MVKNMKNLIKGELYILLRQKSKLLVIPLLLAVYFMGLVSANGLHRQTLNEAQQNYGAISFIVSEERTFDSCALKSPVERKLEPKCKDAVFTERDVERAKKRYPLNTNFAKHNNRMNYWMIEDIKPAYMEERIEMLESAKRMQKAGFPNAYYTINDLSYPGDNKIIDQEISMIKDILDKKYQIQLTPYDINAANYTRVFLSNGGMAAFIMIILLFNMDVFVSESSSSVNNVVYTQVYSRSKINISKIIASIAYSTISIGTVILLGYLIIGIFYGYGNFSYPLYMRPNINTFESFSAKAMIISNIIIHLSYVIPMTLILLVFSLIVMHLVTIIFQNSTPGLFLMYFFLAFRFILKDSVEYLFKFLPFSYDYMDAVFNNDYNFIFGLLSLAVLTVLAFVTLIYVGNRIDLKGGD